MINDNMLSGVASLMAGSTYTVVSHLAFGSTTGTLTATDLITSGEFDRNAIDSKSATGNVVKYIATRSSTEANGTTYLNLIGWHNTSTANSSGYMQANFLIPSLLQTTSFDIEFELWVQFTRG